MILVLSKNIKNEIIETMELKREISSSLEDYLEAIYLFSENGSEARAGQIATYLNVKKSSVTEAIQNLAKEGFINYKPYSPITLTAVGKKAAEKILRKHNIVKDFFREILNLSEEDASEIACKIEHVISDNLASRFGCLHKAILEDKNYKKFLQELHKSF